MFYIKRWLRHVPRLILVGSILCCLKGLHQIYSKCVFFYYSLKLVCYSFTGNLKFIGWIPYLLRFEIYILNVARHCDSVTKNITNEMFSENLFIPFLKLDYCHPSTLKNWLPGHFKIVWQEKWLQCKFQLNIWDAKAHVIQIVKYLKQNYSQRI